MSDPPPRRKRRLIQRIVLGTIGVVLLIGLFLFWRWHHTPSYWRANEALMDEQEEHLPQLANEFESRMISNASRLDTEGADATLVVPYDLANAWLRSKFPKWLANQGYTIPPPFSDFMIAADDGRPIVAFKLTTPEIEQVISMRFEVRLSGDRAHIQLDGCHAGGLRVPVNSIADHLTNKLPAYDIEPLIKLIHGVSIDPVFKHPGHTNRNLRLIGLEMQKDAAVLTLRAERR